MERIEIREAGPADAAQVLRYLKQVGAQTDNLSFGAEGLPFTEAQEAEYLRQQLESEKNVVLLALCGDCVIGDGSLAVLPRRMSYRAELGLSVDKAFWHRGVGGALMEALIDHAKKVGLEVITLEVRSDNVRAIRLYERFGFQKIGTHPANMKIGNAYIDVDIMYRYL